MDELCSKDVRVIFDYHFQKWYEETCFMSTGYFDNPHFDAIVNMGEDVVPFILKIIEDYLYYGIIKILSLLDLVLMVNNLFNF